MVALVESAAELVSVRLAGATDCVRCPVDAEELFARLDGAVADISFANTSNPGAQTDPLRNLGFFAEGDVLLGNLRARLRRAELAVFRYIVDNSPRVVGARELLTVVLGTAGDGATVRNHVFEIRRKLRAAGFPEIVSTVRGVGYVAMTSALEQSFAAKRPGHRTDETIDLTRI